MHDFTSTTINDWTRIAFFKEECNYVEIDYQENPGLVKAMLLAGMSQGSRIVAKFADGDSRYEVYALEYQPTRTIFHYGKQADIILPERYYLTASNHKIDQTDWYQLESQCQFKNGVPAIGWNAVIIPSNPDFSARLYIESDK